MTIAVALDWPGGRGKSISLGLKPSFVESVMSGLMPGHALEVKAKAGAVLLESFERCG
jgi:hypothetical protein